MWNKIRTVQGRLIPIIYRFTIRSILFTGFVLVIALAILTTLLTEWTGDQAMDALNRLITVDNEISDLCLKSNTLMSNARRHEKDFILSYKDFGFNEAKSRYISRVLSNLADMKGNTKKIRLLTDEPEVVRQTLEVDQAVGQYQEKLLVMVEKYGRVGSYDSGLEREFRDTAHEMENLLTTGAGTISSSLTCCRCGAEKKTSSNEAATMMSQSFGKPQPDSRRMWPGPDSPPN